MAYQIVPGSPVFGVNGFYGFGEPRAAAKKPVLAPFKFDCGSLLSPGALKKPEEFRKRVLGAIKLARDAAEALRSPSQKTRDIFREVFGQPTTQDWEKPCCPREKMKAGQLARSRFLRVQKELETRQTIYRCLTADECAREIGRLREEKPRHPTDLIIDDTIALAKLCNDEVLLCPGFWHLTSEQQEGTIVHEMFHLCFGLTCDWFQHDQNERPRNSAYCYEVFALRVNLKNPHQKSIDKCKHVLSKSRNGAAR